MTGPNASGKGAVCAFLATRGFETFSLSDVIREEARRRGLPPEREHLIRLGTEMRATGGPGVLARGLLPRLGRRSVIDSIRNPAEVAVLRELPFFVLVGVRAPIRLRFERSVKRARPGDPRTLEEFEAREAQENSSDRAAQQLDATFALADRHLDNDGDLEQLHVRVLALLEDLGIAAPTRHR
ncbi:MAG: AAA family ATPase [Acidobacteria bacterium]|nr:AAA family ATPase [Acidobacteriota bacterium]NIM62115.1 AAA family ATPase [Acidobacteriota bacterium]NIO59747.1 AAA family ATPase [Acidobacteriota bacterium]NIQ30830.1 AAA family ATPase [Acidobacteriota bacterium]NIQ85903.1 AAA family ATPase [Acidobacteriota bacterium]